MAIASLKEKFIKLFAILERASSIDNPLNLSINDMDESTTDASVVSIV